MGFFAVIVAAAAAFGLGAPWFGWFSRPWLAATGLTEADMKAAGKGPFIVGAVAALLSAGMLRHVLATSGVAGAGAGLVSGLGVGLFLAAPWIAMHYAFARRGVALVLIDGGYVVAAFGLMGLILGAFA